MPAQLALDLPHRPSLSQEEFLTADCNRDAAGWVTRWPDWPGRALVIYGPNGCGKTHLLSIWRQQSAAVLLTPDALPTIDPPAVVRSSRAVAIDDVNHAFCGEAQTALLHLYNLLHEAGGWLLLTGRTPPAAWPISPPDLASRLRSAIVVPISELDDAFMEAVLVKQFTDRQLTVAPDVIRFLCTRLDRTFGAARAAVADLDYASLAKKQVINLRLTRSVFGKPDSSLPADESD